MALYKLNRFHFHLTDDEGWRIEIVEDNPHKIILYSTLKINESKKVLCIKIFKNVYAIEDYMSHVILLLGLHLGQRPCSANLWFRLLVSNLSIHALLYLNLCLNNFVKVRICRL